MAGYLRFVRGAQSLVLHTASLRHVHVSEQLAADSLARLTLAQRQRHNGARQIMTRAAGQHQFFVAFGISRPSLPTSFNTSVPFRPPVPFPQSGIIRQASRIHLTSGRVKKNKQNVVMTELEMIVDAQPKTTKIQAPAPENASKGKNRTVGSEPRGILSLAACHLPLAACHGVNQGSQCRAGRRSSSWSARRRCPSVSALQRS